MMVKIGVPWSTWLVLAAASALAACSAEVEDRPKGSGPTGSGGAGILPGDSNSGTGGGQVNPTPGSGGAGPVACQNPGQISPGESPLRRLNHTEYDNSVQDLLGISSTPARSFPLEERAHSFDNNATVRGTSLILIEQYEAAAHSLAGGVTASALGGLAGCDPAVAGEDACAGMFIANFGRRVYRRPLSAAESSRLQALYTAGKAEHGFSAALQMVAAAIFQSPQFLYRIENAETAGPAVAGGLLETGPFERASRLSYLLTQSAPDAELLALAERGELSTKEQVASQARRLLSLPRARASVLGFHSQWLDFHAMSELVKDASLFPGFTPAVAESMRQEANAFIERTVFDGAGTLGALLTSNQSYMNDMLAEFYGLALPGSATGLVPVQLPANQRAGMLTLAGLLAGHSNPQQGSPVVRGFFVRDALLCQTPAPPPGALNITVPPFDPSLTTRERFEAHSSDPSCRGCHLLMDPIGFGFEHYDAVGMWRDEEAGMPVDAAGALAQTDVDGPFTGAVELAQKLAQSRMLSDCAATRWFHFANGRVEAAEDACALDQLKASFSAASGSIPELLVALTQTDTFLYRKSF